MGRWEERRGHARRKAPRAGMGTREERHGEREERSNKTTRTIKGEVGGDNSLKQQEYFGGLTQVGTQNVKEDSQRKEIYILGNGNHSK